MRVTRWTFLPIYIPSAIGCWGIGHLAGIPDGTGGAVACGYGGGLALTIVIFMAVGRFRRHQIAVGRVEQWRAIALELQRDDPDAFAEIVAFASDGAEVAAARDPVAYVAIWLSYAAEAELEGDATSQELPVWPFEVLGVPTTSTADEVRRAYRALVQRFHPDHNPGDAAAHERFLAVQSAYEELGSP